MWDYGGTTQEKQIQYQSINQGFRMVGSENDKYDLPIKAFKTGDRVSLDYIKQTLKDIGEMNPEGRPKGSGTALLFNMLNGIQEMFSDLKLMSLSQTNLKLMRTDLT